MKTFDVGKTRMIGLPYGEKSCDDMLSRFHLIPERYGRTDRRTNRRTALLYQYRASVISMLTRDKNLNKPILLLSQVQKNLGHGCDDGTAYSVTVTSINY